MKEIPKKKYLLLIIILIVTVILTAIFNNVIRNYNYIKGEQSPLETYISKVDIYELNIALSELNETILYISYNHDKNILKLDRELLKKIKIYNLENYVYYCDVSDKLESNKYIGDFIINFPTINGKLKKVPALVYFKNGEVVEVINSDNKFIDSEDLIYLVNKYNIGK